MKTDRIHSGEKPGKQNRGWDLAFLLTIGVLLGFSVFAGILHMGGFEQDQLRSLVQMFVVIAAFRILISNKYIILVSGGLLVLGIVVLALAPESISINEAIEFVTAVFQYVSGYGEYNTLYEQTFIWFLCVLLGIFIVYFVYILPSFLVLFLVFSGVFGFLISSYAFSNFLLFYLFIFCNLVFLIKRLNLTCVRQTERGAPFLRLVLPLALLCALIAGFIPLPPGELTQNNALQTDFVESLRRMGDRAPIDTGSPYFGIQQTGFGGSDTRRLGGNVSTNEGLFMRIHTEAPQPIYLTGVTMDTYTGYGWENQLRESAPLDFDARHTNLALYESFTTLFYHERAWASDEVYTTVSGGYTELGVTELSDLIFSLHVSVGFTIDVLHQERTIMIGGLNQPIRTVFFPGLVQSFEAYDAEFTLLQEQSGQVLTEELMPRNTWYTMTYFPLHRVAEPSDSYPGILRELAARLEADPSSGAFLMHGQERIDFRSILQDYLIPRADWLHATYTALPEGFPERIGELARTITAFSQNNYERARRLEAHLRTFNYSLTPGMPPADRDFVDYFLFDSQTGYCTYFATAFVTMARSLDIPARYVEGFLVSGAEPDEQGFLHVRNSMGHAWAEVYLEGYGWHRFEPTPPESVIITPPPVEEDIELDEQPDEQPDEPADQVQDNQPVPPAEFPTIPERPDLQAAEDLQDRWWLALIAVVMFILLLLTLRVLWVYTRNKRVHKYENREAVCYYFSILMKYLNLSRFSRQKTETVFQFYDRVTEEPELLNGLIFPRELVEIYAKAYYGDIDISLEERVRMEEEVQGIAKEIQRQKGKWKYLIDKYVLAVI